MAQGRRTRAAVPAELGWTCPRGATRGRVPLAAAALLAVLVLAAGARAHEGPPFPVVVDEVHPGWTVSVWADPDVGTGTLYVQLEPPAGRALPDDVRVTVAVAPADGRQPETRWPAEGETTRFGEQHVAEVDFPTREFWSVRVLVASDATGARSATAFTVEVTPPGYGLVGLLLYSWPFLAVGVLWIMALRRHRGGGRGPVADEEASPAPGDGAPRP